MRPVAPRIEGLEEAHLDGENYKVLPIARAETDDGGPALVSRWRFTEEERTKIAAGEDLFLTIIGRGHPPVQLHVGWPYGHAEAGRT